MIVGNLRKRGCLAENSHPSGKPRLSLAMLVAGLAELLLLQTESISWAD